MKTYKGSYRTADGKAQIDWELEQTENGYKFSACGDYDGSSGQCIDSIAKDYPYDPTVQQMAEVWGHYHLNDMTSGTPRQEACLKQLREAGHPKGDIDYYKWACMALQAAGLYEDLLDPVEEAAIHATGGFEQRRANGGIGKLIYRYGERWLTTPIPQPVIDLILSWQNLPAKAPLHIDKAKQFLAEHGLKMRITLSDTKPAAWEPSGHHYRVTIIRERLKGKAGRVVFDWWGSQMMQEEDREPTEYDVLACVSSDVHTPGTFEEFCSEFGYDTDSIKAKQTFNRADRFAKRLREFFTAQEIEALGGIR